MVGFGKGFQKGLKDLFLYVFVSIKVMHKAADVFFL